MGLIHTEEEEKHLQTREVRKKNIQGEIAKPSKSSKVSSTFNSTKQQNVKTNKGKSKEQSKLDSV
jgi:hypothetical protein